MLRAHGMVLTVVLGWGLLGWGGCGGSSSSPDAAGGDPDAPRIDAQPDAPASNCQSGGVVGQFLRRAGNPRLLPGQTFGDGNLSVAIADPDVRWDAAAARYELYYGAPHASSFTAAAEPMIRRATSPDRMTWTVADAPVLRVAPEVDAWDRQRVEAPSVVYDPAAPADRRYLMMYAGAPGPGASAGTAIGVAFSADGLAFTRVSAAASPHGKAGLVLLGSQAYPAAAASSVSDPEVVLVGGVYHLWFSSQACSTADCATVTDRGIGHATSLNGITWTINEAPVRSLLRVPSDRTSGGRKPSVVYDEPRCRYELWLTNDLPADLTAQPVAVDNTAGVYQAESTDSHGWFVRYDPAPRAPVVRRRGRRGARPRRGHRRRAERRRPAHALRRLRRRGRAAGQHAPQSRRRCAARRRDGAERRDPRSAVVSARARPDQRSARPDQRSVRPDQRSAATIACMFSSRRRARGASVSIAATDENSRWCSIAAPGPPHSKPTSVPRSIVPNTIRFPAERARQLEEQHAPGGALAGAAAEEAELRRVGQVRLQLQRELEPDELAPRHRVAREQRALAEHLHPLGAVVEHVQARDLLPRAQPLQLDRQLRGSPAPDHLGVAQIHPVREHLDVEVGERREPRQRPLADRQHLHRALRPV